MMSSAMEVTNAPRASERNRELPEEVACARLFRSSTPSSVRAWVPNCAAGEGAHALAARIFTLLHNDASTCEVRVFGSEPEADAIGIARMGRYSAEAYANATPELRNFLSPVSGGFQLEKRVRDSVLFSIHDLKSDPPFSRLDLVIADSAFRDTQPEQQGKVLQTLHYAVYPTGMLVFRDHEAVPDEIGGWFSPLDTCTSVFIARPERAPQLSLLQRADAWPGGFRDEYALREAVKQLLLERYAPGCLIVDERRKIVGTLGSASKYLHQPRRAAPPDLLDAIVPELRAVALTLTHETPGRPSPRRTQVEITLDERRVALAVSVHPVTIGGRRFLSLVFVESSPTLSAPKGFDGEQQRRFLERMRHELELLKTEFRASSEELRTTVEELRVLNEELESANHELELTRSQQQLMNEELTSANDELRLTVSELEVANLELRNLVFDPKLAVLLLDSELRVRSFTAAACEFFTLRSTDRGRRLADLAPHFQHQQLRADAERVLATTSELEVEVAVDTRWVALRIVPIRAGGERVTGVALTFTDISGQKVAELELERLRARLATQQRWVERAVAATDRDTPIRPGLD
jgi:two-component system CheB/CheR fusion protein